MSRVDPQVWGAHQERRLRCQEADGAWREAAPLPLIVQWLLWWLQALGFDLATLLLRRLPVDVASGLGSAVFRHLGPWLPADRTVRRNLELAFPQLTRRARDMIRRAYWEEFGRLGFEFPLLDRISLESGRIEVCGMDRLVRLVRSGEGVLLVSGHFSNFEVMAAVLVGAGLPCTVSYRPMANVLVQARIDRCRRRYGLTGLARTGVDGARRLTRDLRCGRAVAMLVDQRSDAGVRSTFFGRPVRSHPGAARLALATGARLTPVSIERTRGARFKVTIHAPLMLGRTECRQADVEAGVCAINAFLERQIWRRPHEWFGCHQRWPAGQYAVRPDMAL